MNGMIDDGLYNELATKFFEHEATDEELERLIGLLKADDEYKKLFDRQNRELKSRDIQQNSELFNVDEAWLTMSGRMSPSETNDRKEKRYVLVRRRSIAWLISAAMIACFLGIGSLLVLRHQSISRGEQASSVVFSTEAGERARVVLSDSTEVFLHSSTQLAYQTDYYKNGRDVYLVGEAYFNVHTDKEKPFIVHLPRMSVIATGTKFNIMAYENESRIETTLQEGEIHVALGGDTIDVSPGQQVVYSMRDDEMIMKTINPEVYISWVDNKLRLDDTSFEESLRRIARRYGVTFEVHGRRLLDLSYTATFVNESIEEVMSLLASVSPIRYEIIRASKTETHGYNKPKIIIEAETK